MSTIPKIGIVVGTTRPGRVGRTVGEWVLKLVASRSDAEFELVDVADFDLPLFDEPVPPSISTGYIHEHTRRWASAISSFDGFLFVTGEYNHSVPSSLTNALSYLAREWNDKAAGLIGYGSVGGSRAIEHLRGILAELQVATVRNTAMFGLLTDFENYTEFKPAAFQADAVQAVAEQTVTWARALRTVRD
ncbi:NADPH-dependent FMN reductase [Streptomyces sp900116325]|uniref:NADPH-dependent FMN reductase n=1 Tax=unclassified Streptomyces TaxID=2593676 RepID=UPI0033FF06CA